ncbi:sensor histidine kinase [Roseateles sp. BYS180W]|uniref:sensor histidine kinase n=1 Tax=Roseateles rivi TaxID=3299028 RepID=UPI003749D89A
MDSSFVRPIWASDGGASTSTAAENSSFGRIYRAFMGARFALAVALLGSQILLWSISGRYYALPFYLALAYVLVTLAGWLQAKRGPAIVTLAGARWWGSVGVDLICFSAALSLELTATTQGALFVLPVLMASMLTPRLWAMATAAFASLVLLGLAVWSVASGADSSSRIPQSGLLGCGLYVISLLSGEIAARLAREERSARGSMALARQQVELNRLVIDEMQDGVMVADQRGKVRVANPAALALLTLEGQRPVLPFVLNQSPGWSSLREAVLQGYRSLQWPESGMDIELREAGKVVRTLRVRGCFARNPQSGGHLCVMFLEDSRQLQARSRQEKLVAMGRMSAGIAHEIRNPLAAIAQASDLLAEEVQDPRHQRLLGMVQTNVTRLKRIVDDVMEVAPGHAPQPQSLLLEPLVEDFCEDWLRTQGLASGAQSRLHLELTGLPLWISFDAEHLRRVLVNLLDNALRHANNEPGAVRVQLQPRDERFLVLVVGNMAPPIAAEVEPHLFEPFFSTRSRGTGLGLYICRELCERYGGRIFYRYSGDYNEFCVLLPRAPAPGIANNKP